MSLKINDASVHAGSEPLIAKDGKLAPKAKGSVIIKDYLLATWNLFGSMCPTALNETYVNGYLYDDEYEGKKIWLCTIVFLFAGRPNTLGFWKTFNVAYTDGKYDPSLDDELQLLLKKELTRCT